MLYLRSILVLIVLLGLSWVFWNRTEKFETQIIFEVESESSDYAALYADHGKGLKSCESLINQYQSHDNPTRMYFPCELRSVKYLRFDPVIATEGASVSITLHRIAVQTAPWAQPVDIPLANLRNLRGVRKTQPPNGAVKLEIPAQTLDPQMELKLPENLQKSIRAQNQWVQVIEACFLAGTMLLGLIAYVGVHKILSPYPDPSDV